MSVINPSNVTKNDLIVALVQKELQFSAMLGSLVTDVSAFAQKGMKTIAFPKLSSFSVSNRAFGTAGSATTISDTVDVLNLNESAYVSYIIDTKSALQSSINWEMETAKRAGSAHGRYVDTKIVAVLEAVGTPVGIAGDITKNIVIEMKKKLKQANADMNNCALVLSAYQEAKVLAIDEFTRWDMYNTPVIMTGAIGKLFGLPVVISNALADGQFFAFEKSGVAIGYQSAPAYGEQTALEYGVGSMLRAVDQLFGVCGLQLTGGLSPLVIKHGA
jgi:hypothetical protein